LNEDVIRLEFDGLKPNTKYYFKFYSNLTNTCNTEDRSEETYYSESTIKSSDGNVYYIMKV